MISTRSERQLAKRRFRQFSDLNDAIKGGNLKPYQLRDLGISAWDAMQAGEVGYPLISGGAPDLGENLPSLLPDPTGTIYYVDYTNGNDTTGTGSSGAPWKTLQKAVDSGFSSTPANKTIRLKAGDMGLPGVNGVGGTTTTISGKNGTVTQPWCIEADVGVTATIRGRVRIDNCDYGIVRSGPGTLKGRGHRSAGDTVLWRVAVGSNTINLLDLEVYESGPDWDANNHSNANLWVGSATQNLLVLRCNIHDGGTSPGSNTWGQGIYWTDGHGWVLDTLMWNNAHAGIQWYSQNANKSIWLVGDLSFANNDGFHYNSDGPNAHALQYNSITRNNNGTRGYGVSTGSRAGFDLMVKNCGIFGNETAFDWQAVTGEQANNITTDPLHVNYAGGNYHLQSGSPMRGAGAWPGETWPTDRDGLARVEPVDIGPYAFEAGPPPFPEDPPPGDTEPPPEVYDPRVDALIPAMKAFSRRTKNTTGKHLAAEIARVLEQ